VIITLLELDRVVISN